MKQKRRKKKKYKEEVEKEEEKKKKKRERKREREGNGVKGHKFGFKKCCTVCLLSQYQAACVIKAPTNNYHFHHCSSAHLRKCTPRTGGGGGN